MNDEIKNINLSFLCRENWDGMKVTDQKRMCDKCKHQVRDFTEMKNDEFQQVIKNPKEPVCGRFFSTQLSKSFLKYAASTLVAAASIAPIACTNENGKQEVLSEDSPYARQLNPADFIDAREDSVVTVGLVVTPEQQQPENTVHKHYLRPAREL